MIENPACDGNKMTGVGTWRTCRGQSATSPSGSCSWKKGVFAQTVLSPFFILILCYDIKYPYFLYQINRFLFSYFTRLLSSKSGVHSP